MNAFPFSSKKGLLKPALFLMGTAAVLAATPLTHAAVAVSNLGIADSVSGAWAVRTGEYVGMSFTVGSDYSTWSLDSVDIKAFSLEALPEDFVVELHADDGSGKPAVAALVTFTGANPGTAAEYNYVPAAPFTLNAGLTYWLTAESSAVDGSKNEYGWFYTSPQSGAESTSLTGWSIGDNVAGSFDQGASWVVFPVSPTKFAVNASQAVPEPGALGLLALGALAAATRRRRRVG